jgi:hypothetical protein
MPSRLPDNYKSLVIQEWLNGEQRDKIAVDNGLGAGSVTNIVNEWRAALRFPTADALRELAVTLRRLGITAAQCALGFRTAALMLRIGVKEDSFELFILDVYNRCKDIGLSPQNIALHLTDLLEFSKTVSLSEIPQYLREKTNEKAKLEEEKENLEVVIELLQEEKSHAQSLLDKALQDEKTTSSELKWYTNLREELRKYAIPVDDIPKLAKLFNNIAQYGYNIENVVNEFLNLEAIRVRHKYLQEEIQSLENTEKDLKQRCSSLEEEELIRTHRISLYHELEKIGMGIKELKLLRYTVAEIANANNIPQDRAIHKFFTDVQQQYDYKLGFEAKIQNLKSQIQIIEEMELRLATFTIILNSIILMQFDQIQGVSGFVEFGPLVKAAKGQNVPKNQLKNAVIKAIQILISSDPTDRSISTLKATQILLQNDIRDSGNIS